MASAAVRPDVRAQWQDLAGSLLLKRDSAVSRPSGAVGPPSLRISAALAELHADVPIPSRKRAADGGQVGSRLETSPQRCGNHGKVATAMGGASPRQMVPTSTSEEGGAAGAEQLLDKTKVNDQAEVNEQTMDATLPWPDRGEAGVPGGTGAYGGWTGAGDRARTQERDRAKRQWRDEGGRGKQAQYPGMCTPGVLIPRKSARSDRARARTVRH